MPKACKSIIAALYISIAMGTITLLALPIGCTQPDQRTALTRTTQTYDLILEVLVEMRKDGMLDDEEAQEIEKVRSELSTTLREWRKAIEEGGTFEDYVSKTDELIIRLMKLKEKAKDGDD